MYIISVDGIDGVGKSTYCNTLQQKYKNSIVIHFPRYNTDTGKKIKEMLNSNDIDNSKIQSLCVIDMMAFRKDVLEGRYDVFNTLILDRSILSTIAYSDNEYIKDFSLFLLKEDKIVKPDESIIITADYNDFITIEERLSKKNRDKFEDIEFLKQINDIFLNINDMYGDFFNFNIIKMQH